MCIGVILELEKGVRASPMRDTPNAHQTKLGEGMFGHMAQQMRDMCLEMSGIHVHTCFSLYSSSIHPISQKILPNISPFSKCLTVFVFPMQVKNKPHGGFANVRYSLTQRCREH
jgi:hypothetical protein